MVGGSPVGPHFLWAVGMATRLDDEDNDIRNRNRELRQPLADCRELLKRTQELLERADRLGGPPPANDRSA